MTWKRIAAYAALGLLALLLLATAALYIAAPFAPPIRVDDPGPGGVRVTENGLLANWHPAPGTGSGAGRGPAILALGGSEGGMSSKWAGEYTRAGISVLTISYFRAPGQSPTLENAPLETFDRALAWLAKRPEVDPARIGIVGGSKGAEAALIVTSRHPGIRAVVAGMPSHVMWQGIDWSGFRFGAGDAASWSLAGRPLPFVPYGRIDWKRGPVSLYEDGLTRLAAHQDAIIPIERSRAAILLICGEQDFLWPSCPMARAAKARASTAGGPAVTVLAYPNAGHGVFGPPREPGKVEGLGSMGGTDAGNQAARQDGWPKAIAFLQHHLGAPRPAP